MRTTLSTTLIRIGLQKELSSGSPRGTSALCDRCRALRLSASKTPFNPYQPNRNLSTHLSLSAKHGGKTSSKRTIPLNADKTSDLDPFDFSDFDDEVKRTQEHLENELARVKAGGRDPEVIEEIRVKLRDGGDDGGGGGGGGGGGKGGKKNEGRGKEGEKGKGGTVVTVGDVASVVRRGRNLAVLVGEKDHLKPLLSALSSHPIPLSPSSSPTDPLTILIPLPPPTAESRHEASTLAHKKGEEALFSLREARGAQRKKLRAMDLGRQVGPDERRRAEKELERRNEGVVARVKKIVEGWRRGIEGGGERG